MLHFPWNITDSKQDQQGRDKTTALVHYLKKISKVKEYIYIYIEYSMIHTLTKSKA